MPPHDAALTDAPLTDAEVHRIRADFPILATRMSGHPLVYLDSAATSQKPRAVLDAERAYYEGANAAVHRGAHTLAAEATELFEDARSTVARFVGAAEDEIVWTSNATEAINLVAYGFSNASLGRGGEEARRFRLGPGDEIVVTEMEHHANLLPWQELAARTGATLRFIPIEDDGSLRLESAADDDQRPHEAPGVHPRLQRAGADQSRRRTRASRPRRRARSCCSTRASRRRTSRST